MCNPDENSKQRMTVFTHKNRTQAHTNHREFKKKRKSDLNSNSKSIKIYNLNPLIY